jgi:hypothetical protein
MLRLKPEQRALLREKIPDLANVAAGVLVFGPFVMGESLSTNLVIAGALLWFFLIGLALAISED